MFALLKVTRYSTYLDRGFFCEDDTEPCVDGEPNALRVTINSSSLPNMPYGQTLNGTSVYTRKESERGISFVSSKDNGGIAGGFYFIDNVWRLDYAIEKAGVAEQRGHVSLLHSNSSSKCLMNVKWWYYYDKKNKLWKPTNEVDIVDEATYEEPARATSSPETDRAAENPPETGSKADLPTTNSPQPFPVMGSMIISTAYSDETGDKSSEDDSGSVATSDTVTSLEVEV